MAEHTASNKKEFSVCLFILNLVFAYLSLLQYIHAELCYTILKLFYYSNSMIMKSSKPCFRGGIIWLKLQE